MLKHLLNRSGLSDEDRMRSSLSRASDRHFAQRLRALRRHRGRLEDLHDLALELSALKAMRESLRTLTPEESVGRLRPPRAQEAGDGIIDRTVPMFAAGADLLFALHHTLFPAERMAVIGGRSERGRVLLSSFFDVTSEKESSGAYTRADAGKLGAALTAMDTTGTRLVGWAHSHPGLGAQASLPSATDRRQYNAWAADYGALLALIFTEDGHVRFWGEAGGSIGIVGTGVERRAYDLYRFRR